MIRPFNIELMNDLYADIVQTYPTSRLGGWLTLYALGYLPKPYDVIGLLPNPKAHYFIKDKIIYHIFENDTAPTIILHLVNAVNDDMGFCVIEFDEKNHLMARCTLIDQERFDVFMDALRL